MLLGTGSLLAHFLGSPLAADPIQPPPFYQLHAAPALLSRSHSMDPSSLSSLGPENWPFPAVGAPPPYVRPVITRPGRVAPAEESVVTGPSRESSKGRRKRKDSAATEDEFSKPVPTSGGQDLPNVKAKHMKTIITNDNNNNVKTEVEVSSGACDNNTNDGKPQQELPKQDYIHVRARRGQATDSHSLAERARREKISERMKILQDLVPGCNRVIGKTSVLDEIINYIQALQHQIEFLSMKLEAVTPRAHPGFEVFPHKDFTLQADDSASSLPSSSLATRDYEQGSAAGWLHMQLGGAFERVT